MIATFIIDWPILAFFGFLFGNEAREPRWWTSPAFAGGLLATGGFTASALLSYRHAPDWMWMYYGDSDRLHPWARWMGPGYVLAYVLTFGMAARRAQEGRSSRTSAALSLVAEAAVVAATWDRYHRVGSKEEWETGRASELITAKPEGTAKKIGSYGPMVAAAFVAGLALMMKSRASRPRR